MLYIYNQYIFKRTHDQSGKFTILSNIFSKNKDGNSGIYLRALLFLLFAILLSHR
jgi:hypothetical protein